MKIKNDLTKEIKTKENFEEYILATEKSIENLKNTFYLLNKIGFLLAPFISEDIREIRLKIIALKKLLKEKIAALKEKSRKALEKINENKTLQKRQIVVELLKIILKKCNISENAKKEILQLLNEIDGYNVSKLDAQINKLRNFLKIYQISG